MGNMVLWVEVGSSGGSWFLKFGLLLVVIGGGLRFDVCICWVLGLDENWGYIYLHIVEQD